ncbi:MAG: hypothetical protein ACI95C_001536 [Pseudohongiellaceae bacterium]
MLDRLQSIARRLWQFRLLLVLLAIIGLVGFSLSLFDAPVLNGAQVMMPSLVLLFWAMTGLSFGSLFFNIPDQPQADAGLGLRWSLKIKRSVYWIIGAGMIVLVLSLVVLSYQLIRAWSMA